MPLSECRRILPYSKNVDQTPRGWIKEEDMVLHLNHRLEKSIIISRWMGLSTESVEYASVDSANLQFANLSYD